MTKQMTPGEQHQAFVEAMLAIQKDRKDETADHTWKAHLDRYGLAIYFADLAGIVGRLEGLVWKRRYDDLTPRQQEKVIDLLVDLGNYAGFMYEWLQGQPKVTISSEIPANPNRGVTG